MMSQDGDDLVWLVENQSDLPDKIKVIRFPADFGSKGGIHGNRPHRGKAAKYADGTGVWRYRISQTQSGDNYPLWGVEWPYYLQIEIAQHKPMNTSDLETQLAELKCAVGDLSIDDI